MSRKGFVVAPLNEQNELTDSPPKVQQSANLVSPIPQRSPGLALRRLNNIERPQPSIGTQSPNTHEEIASILRRSSHTGASAFHPKMLMVMSTTDMADLEVGGTLSPVAVSPLFNNAKAVRTAGSFSPPLRGSNPIVNDAAFVSVLGAFPSAAAGTLRKDNHVAADLSLLRLSPMSI